MSNSEDSYKKLWRYVSESKLLLMRNLSFGGAGICVAVILVLTQVGIKDIFYLVALTSASIATPAWVALASSYETYIFLGKRSYAHLRSPLTQHLLAPMMLTGAIGLLVSLTALIWHLSELAVECFAGSAVSMTALSLWLGQSTLKSGDHLRSNSQHDAQADRPE